MIIKYQHNIIGDYCDFVFKTANGILGIKKSSSSSNNTIELPKITGNTDICIIGDGAVKDKKIRAILEQKFGKGYFEEILKYSYLKRRIVDRHKKYFIDYKTHLRAISDGISSVLNTKIYPTSLMKNDLTYIGNQIKCYPSYHNEHNLQWYKSIIDKLLSKIDWVIDFATGKYEWDNNVDAQNYVSNQFTSVLRMVEQLLKIQDEPLDLTRHLAQYHYLPTQEVHHGLSNTFDLIKIIEIITNRLKYDEFMRNLADSINSQSSELREIPQEIKLNNNVWFISLNWCNSDICNLDISNLLKLHGSCQNYHSMILPTEELDDNIFMNDNYIAQSAYNLVQKCNILYLWGTSLSDYDVEIHHLISAGQNIKQIVVINPDEEIYKKVKFLTRIYALNNVEVIHKFNQKVDQV